jgi:hypothetical protein
MIPDPGKDKPTAEEKKAARLNDWKRPTSANKREELRADRMAPFTSTATTTTTATTILAEVKKSDSDSKVKSNS